MDKNAEMLGGGTETTQPLTLLVTSDEDGALILSVSGLFPVVRIQLQGPAAVAVECCASGDLRTLHVWVQTVEGPKLETYDMEFLATRQSEVSYLPSELK